MFMAVKTIEKGQSTAPVVVAEANSMVFANLAATLAEVRKLKGVLGYILRSSTTAVVDLTQKESVADYAMLSYEVHDCAGAVSRQFKLADVECAVVEGQTAKVLCMCIGENRLAVFMEKTCAHAWIVKRILI
jgi:predicted regulator of Ras-like GTPase activity (Roadblock/LC7/MglB family)